MIDRDRVALETAATRRQRLLSAMTFGDIADRRVTGNNLGRLVGSASIAALVGAGCLGTSFVLHTLDSQNIRKTNSDYLAALNGGAAPTPGATADSHGRKVVPGSNGTTVVGPFGLHYDFQTGWQVEKGSSYLIDPATNWVVDPTTGKAVRKAHR